MKMDRRTFVAGVAALAGARAGRADGAEYPVTHYGAVGDGVTKDTGAFQRAIEEAVRYRGSVTVPAGTFLIGGLQMRSGVKLVLAQGAVLKGSPDFADYRVGKVRWEGKWIDGYEGLITGRDCHDVAVTGPGRIEGPHELGGRPSADKPLRHPCLIEWINCSNVELEGFSTDYARMWSVHPTYCEDVTIARLTIRSVGENGDGIDVDSCRRVTIDGCDIATGDDCISIKSGRGMEGFLAARPSEDVTITNCTFNDSIFACIGIGSETSGGIRRVKVSKCRFTGARTYAFYIKSRPGRGAFVEDISLNDCDVTGEYGGGFLRFNMTGSGLQDEMPVQGLVGIADLARWSFTNIRISHVPVLVLGTAIPPEKPLDGLRLENIRGRCDRGVSLAHVRGAVVKDLSVECDAGSLFELTDVQGTGFEVKKQGERAAVSRTPAPRTPVPRTPVPERRDP